MTHENTDEIEICQNIEPHEDDNTVKSKAVVKFSTVHVPEQFTRLQCNTDLNLPPSNWLSNSQSAYKLHQSLYHSPGFASFRMANMFPECLGEVDVVSDAENIKTLLKLPYAPKTPISMMVHKVGNTLLIDEFDIQKYLLRKADDDWKWLRTFILENILSSLSEKDRSFCLKDKSRSALQRKNLLSKFLYHSLQQQQQSESTTDDNKTSHNIDPVESVTQQSNSKQPLLLTGPIFPEPKLEENVPDPNSTNHVFHRNIVWTFEDIRMLIGNDMPIFGGGTRPCISLRLRDMTKPINVLTGIDYWLDNLMCNVPEVVMCYHLDGIVQKYELIKTEDLPYLEDSKFSPQVIRKVAQNILAFLKANATKAGHTYWLFKRKNDDVVKLYDLTTLCKNGSEANDDDNKDDEKYENPFTVPVAMLLYTVARNMRNTSNGKITSKKAGSIKSLLDNCIKLLPKEKFPQIVTSSHYILSDLHIPDDIDPMSPNFDLNCDTDSDTQSEFDDDFNIDCDSPTENGESDENDTIAVTNICDTLKEFNGDDKKYDRSPSPLTATLEERCKISLEHIAHGIGCLKYLSNNKNENSDEKESKNFKQEKQKIIYEEQNPNMAKPFQPIPLPYETLKPEPKIPNSHEAIPMGWQEKVEKEKNDNSNDLITNDDTGNYGNTKLKKKSKDDKKLQQKDKNQQTKPEDSATIHSSDTGIEEANPYKIMIKESLQKFGTWDLYLKLLLLQKASVTYTTFAQYNFRMGNYGTCLKCVYMAYRCEQVVVKYVPNFKIDKITLLKCAGDCLLQLGLLWENIDTYLKQYEEMNEADTVILQQTKEDCQKDKWDELPEPTNNVEQLLLASCKCYETALESADKEFHYELLKRYGNVQNELGTKYMIWANEEAKRLENSEEEDNDTEPLYLTLLKKSYDCLIRGLDAFEKVDDATNVALLLNNLGRYMRLYAYLHLDGNNLEDIKLKKKYYNLAFTYYHRALAVLGTRKHDPKTWDVVTWELSGAAFELAKQVQDSNLKNEIFSDKADREVLELMQKALKLCDPTTPGFRQCLHQYRTGEIHHRLGNFYHNQLIRNMKIDENSTKKTLQLCRLHYEKASKVFLELKEEIKDFLKVQLDRIKLQEDIADASNFHQKIKSLQTALDICCQTRLIFISIMEDLTEKLTEENLTLLRKLESQLQKFLRNLTKLCLSKSNSKELIKLGNNYKSMYSMTLNLKQASEGEKYIEHLIVVFGKITKMLEEKK